LSYRQRGAVLARDDFNEQKRPAVSSVAKPIRIEPAFDDPDQVRTLFERYAPYPAIAGYQINREHIADVAVPWFRGNWAADGEPLVDGAEKILHNPRFIDAARAFFGTSKLRPTFIVINVNAPMSAGQPHVDIPTFSGAARDQYPLGFLKAMGASGLFERWRIIQAGAVAWFYEGPGGNFEYWPEGLDGPMLTERPPFRNVAIMADNDRMYHRIGRIGEPNAKIPRMTAAAEIRPGGAGAWAIVENGETRATYPSAAVRLSIVWKADLETEAQAEPLSLDHVMSVFISDLRKQGADFHLPTNPLSDNEWMALLDRIYGDNPISETVKE
jgi:hypothetical protein